MGGHSSLCVDRGTHKGVVNGDYELGPFWPCGPPIGSYSLLASARRRPVRRIAALAMTATAVARHKAHGIARYFVKFKSLLRKPKPLACSKPSPRFILSLS